MLKANDFKNLAHKLDYTNDGCTGVPDVNEDVLECCNEHDFDWRNPHLGVGMFKANWRFFKCLKRCRAKSRKEKIARLGLACLYYGGVSTFGVLFYVKEEWVNYKYDDDDAGIYS